MNPMLNENTTLPDAAPTGPATTTTRTITMRDKVRAFVTSNFYVADPSRLQDSESLLDSGIMDSTGVLEVIGFIEDSFGLAVEDHEMVPENLDSIERIASFIQRKQV